MNQLIIFHANRSKVEEYMDGISPALTARCGTGGVDMPMITENENPTVIPDISGTCNPAGDEMQNMVAKAPDYRIRRLTPLECGRLQGFPDDWTEDLSIIFPEEEQVETWLQRWEDAGRPKTRNQVIKWLYNPVSDSALYKMWGNGVALPCVLFVMEGIAKHKRMEEDK